ncbi:MAG: hypothetical protein K6F00_02355 [Lachnospiraceae bacterium]|nr:hypothetical protein [Lachnospiraceae bacterium]
MADERSPDLFDKKLPQLVYELEKERDTEKANAKEVKQTSVLVMIVSLVMAGIISAGAFLIADRLPGSGIAERIEKIYDQTVDEDESQNEGSKAEAVENEEIKKIEDTDESISEKDLQQVEEGNTQEENTTENQKKEKAPVKEKEEQKKKEDKAHKTKNIYYDRKTKELSFELDGKSYIFPVSSEKLSKNGWAKVDEATDPNNDKLTASTLFDDSGSTVFIYKNKDDKAAQKMEVVFANKKTSFMGISLKSKPNAVKKILKKAKQIKKDGFRKGNGRILYSVGECVIGVNYANGTAFSVSLEKGEIDG